MSQDKLAAMQQRIEQLAYLLSIESGQNHANTAVLLGLLAALKDQPGVREAIDSHVESLYAPMLASHRNSTHLEAFEERVEFFRALLVDG